MRKRKLDSRSASCSMESSIDTRSRKRARLEKEVVVLDSSDESEHSAESIVVVARADPSSSYPQHRAHDRSHIETVSLLESDNEVADGNHTKRLLARRNSDSVAYHSMDRNLPKLPQLITASTETPSEAVIIVQSDSQEAEAEANINLAAAAEKDRPSDVTRVIPENFVTTLPPATAVDLPAVLAPESPTLTPAAMSRPDYGGVQDTHTAASNVSTDRKSISKINASTLEVVPMAGSYVEQDTSFLPSPAFSPSPVSRHPSDPNGQQYSQDLDEVNSIGYPSPAANRGPVALSRAGSAGIDDRKTPERMKYLALFDRILSTVLQFESHLFNEHERELLMLFCRLEEHCRYIYTRLFMRKHAWIRVSSIKYGDDYVVEQACTALCRPTVGGDSFLMNESQLDDCNGALMLLVSAELKDMAKKRGIKQVTGKTKEVLCEMITKSAKQRTVMSFFKKKNDVSPNNRLGELIDDVVKITGPMVKLNPVAAELFERIHMIFFRKQSGSGLDNTMKQAVLALIGQIKFPQYTVLRSGNLFASREDVIQFKNLMKVGSDMASFRHALVKDIEQHKKGWELYQEYCGAWSNHIEALNRAASRSVTQRPGISGIEYWKRRFTPGYALSRIVEHATHCAAALKKYEDEEKILRSLLSQHTYRLNKRGEWYERLVVLYNNHLRPRANAKDKEAMSQIRQWMQLARDTCIMALNDEHVHRVVIHNLSQQLRKIEAKLGVTEDGQYENERMCLEWKDAPEHTVYGVRIKDRGRRGPSLWDGDDGIPCSVENLALWRYKENGYIGMHSENALVTTLFTLLFWDVIFLPLPGVLDTEYQSCPLDMFAPSFYDSRKEAIDGRLSEIESGKFADRLVLSYNSGNGTSCVGVSWDITVRNLLTVAECLGGRRLAAICSVLAKEYSAKSSGFPDLCLWKPGTSEIMFAEVKGPKDKLSETQRDWIDILIDIGIDVEVCLVREGDARDFE